MLPGWIPLRLKPLSFFKRHTQIDKKNQHMSTFFSFFFLPKMSFCVCPSRFPLLVPLAWEGHAGRSCAPAASLLCLWQLDGVLPWDLPPWQHPAGAAALHPHHPAGDLVLGGKKKQSCEKRTIAPSGLHPCSAHLPLLNSDWFCALPSSWTRVGPQRPRQHDVHHHVLHLASGPRHADCGRAALCR